MIYGERIRLVAIEREDLPLFVKWLNDPEVRRGLELYLPISMAQEEKWFEKMLDRPQDTQPLNIEARDKDEWIKIGNMGLFQIDQRARSAEVGIMIGHKAFWNKGYGTEAITLLLKHGFETLNLNRIMLRVYADNPRAIRCYEKAGFIVEGRLRDARYFDGAYWDILLMSVIKSEWDDRSRVKDDK
jgi:RimJ/RimL family protein N-acetyltransferase